MATVHANKILTKFMLLLGDHNHCVKVSSDSERVRGMGLWEFSGALRDLMLNTILMLANFCLEIWSRVSGVGPGFYSFPLLSTVFYENQNLSAGKEERIISHAFSSFRWREIQPQP